MKIKLTKKQATLLLACVAEIQQSDFWYNAEVQEPISKTQAGEIAVNSLVNELLNQGIDIPGNASNSIYSELFVSMVPK